MPYIVYMPQNKIIYEKEGYSCGGKGRAIVLHVGGVVIVLPCIEGVVNFVDP